MEFYEYALIYLVVGVVCGMICQGIASSRKMNGGFWWGFWLGIIGIIIVAVRPNDGNISTNSQVIKDGIERIYYCKKCKRTYSSFTQCNCPTCKDTILTPTTIMLSEWSDLTEEQKDKMRTDFSSGKTLLTSLESERIDTKTTGLYDEIKQLKKLQDEGLITQEEFEAKKKKILDL